MIDYRLSNMIEEAYESAQIPDIVGGWVYGLIIDAGGLLVGKAGWTAYAAGSASGPYIIVAGAGMVIGGTGLFIWDVADSIKIPPYFDVEFYENLREIEDLDEFLRGLDPPL